eukprot:c27079_g2_i1 orf=2-4114(-)
MQSEMEAVTSSPSKFAKHVYTRDFLMSFADLEDCKKQLEGLDLVVLRDACTDLVTGGVAVPAVSSRGLIRQDRESNGVLDGSQDVPEWRRPLSNSGGVLLQQGHRRNELSGNFSSRLSSMRGENANLRNSFEKTGWPGSGSYTGQGRWDHRSGLGDRERERNRPYHDRDYPESDANGRLRGTGLNSFRQGLVQHEHDGLLGSGNVIRSSSAGGLIPTHTRATDRYHGPGRMGRSNEQYSPRAMKTSTFPHQDKDSVNEETFGPEECTSEEKSEQERQRRESFQRMRKEQQRLLQEKHKIQIQEHEEPYQLDLNATSKRKEDENIVWDGQNSEALLPSSPRMPHSVCSKDSSSKLFCANAVTTGTSLLTPSRPLVPPGFSKPAFQKQASLNGEKKEDIADMDKKLNMEDDSGGFEKTDNSTFADTALSEASVRKESSESILDKLFGKAGATSEKRDTLPRGILLEESQVLSGEHDTWSQISPKASKFAQWFHTEGGDDKYRDSSAVGGSSYFLSTSENRVASESLSRNSSTNSIPKLSKAESQALLPKSHQNILSLSKIDNQSTISNSSTGQSSLLQSENHIMAYPESSGSSIVLPLLPKGESGSDSCSSTSSSQSILSLICKNENRAAASTLSASMPLGNSVGILEENNIGNFTSLLPLKGQGQVLPMPAGPSLEDVEKIFTDIATTTAEEKIEHASIDHDFVTLDKNFDLVYSDEGISCLLKPKAASEESFQHVSEDLFRRPFSKPKVLPKIPPVFLTCEDLEQSMLAEASYIPEKRMATADNNFCSGKEVQDLESQIDNDASQHLLILLQKGNARTSPLDLPEERKPCNDSVEEGIILDGTSSSQSVDQVAEVIGEVKDDQNTEMQTLETLFGKAFMRQLQSMEAPVSGKTLPYYPVCSDTEDGFQSLVKNISYSRQLSAGSDDSVKGFNDAKACLGTTRKIGTIGFSDSSNTELCKGVRPSESGQSHLSGTGNIDEDMNTVHSTLNGLWDNFTSQFHLGTGGNSDVSLLMGSGPTASGSDILDVLEKENSDSSSSLQKQIIDSTVSPEDAIMDSGVAFDRLSNFNESRDQATNFIFDSRGKIGLPKSNITKATLVNDYKKNIQERGEGPVNESGGIGGVYSKLGQASSKNVMARTGSDTEKMIVNCFPKEHTLSSKNIVDTSVAGSQVLNCLADEGRAGRLNKATEFELLQASGVDGFQYHSDGGRDFPEIFGMDGDIRAFHSRSPYITSAESSIEGHYPHSMSGVPTRNRTQTSLSFPELQHSILLSQQQHPRAPSKSQPVFPGIHFRPPLFSAPQHTSGLQDVLPDLQRDDILQNGLHPHLRLQSMPFSSGTQNEPRRFPPGCPPNFVPGRSFSGEIPSGQLQYPS